MKDPRPTGDLVAQLCAEIGHDEASKLCIKKLVQEHKLTDLAELSEIPRERVESWGIPLKLVALMYEELDDDTATVIANNISSFVNYSLRIKVAQLQSGAVELWQKNGNPEEWATLKIQRNYRRRKQRQRDLEERAALAWEEDVLEEDASEDKVLRMNEEEKYALRKHRAEEKLRRFIRRYKERQKASPFHKAAAGHVPVASLDLPEAIERAAGENIPDCDVAKLLQKIADEMSKKMGGDNAQAEIDKQISRIVRQNWIQEVVDIDLVHPRHWKAWGTDEHVQERLKKEADKLSSSTMTERANCHKCAIS